MKNNEPSEAGSEFSYHEQNSLTATPNAKAADTIATFISGSNTKFKRIRKRSSKKSGFWSIL